MINCSGISRAGILQIKMFLCHFGIDQKSAPLVKGRIWQEYH